MEVDVPYSYRVLSKTLKQKVLKSDPFVKFRFEGTTNKDFLKPKPALDQPTTTTSELPSLSQVSPVKSTKGARKRSSSMGNNTTKAERSKIPDLKIAVVPEKFTTLLKSHAEFLPINIRAPEPTRYPAGLRKRPIDPEDKKHLSESPAKERGEPMRIPLDQVFSFVKKEKKDGNQINRSNGSNSERKLPNLLLPKVWQDITPKDLVFAPNVPQPLISKHFNGVVQGIKYAIGNLKPVPIVQLSPVQISLEKRADCPSKTLLLDLDETLIFAKTTEESNNAKFHSTGKGDGSTLIVKVRPFARDFLREMSKEFEIIIFTAAEKSYAENVVKFLDPEGKYISHLLHRAHCLKTKRGLFIKDLRIIFDRDLKDMVLVDNFTPSFSFQIENGIPIITWEGDPKDQELKYLMPYLLEAKKYDDMRQFNRERLRLEELAHIPEQNFQDI